jgi:hypothetical protein
MQGISDAYTDLRSIVYLESIVNETLLKKSIIKFKKLVFKFITLNSTFDFKDFIFSVSHFFGYFLLRYKFKSSSEVKSWVLKKNYLDYDRLR